VNGNSAHVEMIFTLLGLISTSHVAISLLIILSGLATTFQTICKTYSAFISSKFHHSQEKSDFGSIVICVIQ
jgi:mannose/fructose/N-acetylgalactosamine-specific phosphotransferase system component IIC